MKNLFYVNYWGGIMVMSLSILKTNDNSYRIGLTELLISVTIEELGVIDELCSFELLRIIQK